ncbi:MAG: hypothetical protein AAGN82_00760 [Myxococcota bacterium]
MSARGSGLRAAALAIGLVLPMLVWQWGFTVDDALISARYAHHVATGVGYRFNPGGPVTDGVTPLGWAYVLAPWAEVSPWAGYRAAKWLGALAWLLGVGALGVAVGRIDGRARRWAALSLLATSVPVAAWVASGMETGVVLGAAAGAAAARSLGRDRIAAGQLGFLAAWRPEALPLALVGGGLAPGRYPAPPRERWIRIGLSLGPAILVAGVRFVVFGRFVPLAAWAKRPVAALGVRYAVASFLVLGAVAALTWPRAPGWIRGLQVAVLVHFAAVAMVGGDWMPLARLGVVAMPFVTLVAADRLARSGAWRWLPLGLALAGPVYTAAHMGPRSAGVEASRRALIEAAREPLRASRVVATLDSGWVGAVHPGPIVDLAGVTDPAVAVLRGGHTSKRIGRGMLAQRGVDTLVLLRAGPLRRPWSETTWSRAVEARVARFPEVATRFSDPVVVAPLPYVVVRLTGPRR